MSTAPTGFTSCQDLDGVFVAQKGTLRCTAVRLATGSLCLYSPVRGLGDAVWDSLKGCGEVTHVLAPNHYHHMGLRECSEAFPGAKLCCSPQAMPRLGDCTGLTLATLEQAGLELPTGARLLEPPGLKTGEVWIEVASRGQAIWIVTDAFCGPKVKSAGVADRLEMLGTFPRFGVADGEIYGAWLSAALDGLELRMVIPCHGSLVVGADLAPQARTLAAVL